VEELIIAMPASWLLLIIIVLLLVFALPQWPYSSPWRGYGRGYYYYPSGALGLVLLILLILVLLGRF
jgi:hypothetical protein